MPSVGFNQYDTAFSHVEFERLSRTKSLTALLARVAPIAA
jgi:hypothetical protein